MQRARFLSALTLAGIAPWVRAQPAPLRFVYPNLDGLGEAAFGYRALRLALQKWGGPFELKLNSSPSNHGRARQMLDAGLIDVGDWGTSPEFERQLQAVHLPIDRGLNGWRLFIIREPMAPRFEAVQDLDSLARLAAGQGADWADVALLQAARLPVVRGASLDTLFRMLEAGRFDYLPLGLNEVYGLLEHHRALAPSCIVENRLTLVYPFARLFFVRRGDAERHAALLQGLTRAFEDGSLQALLAADPSMQSAMARARLAGRRQLRIDNPLMTDATRAIPARYFHTP
jgi:hypothetical protein